MWVIDSISILYAPFIPESSAKVQDLFESDLDVKGKFEVGEKVNPDGVQRQFFHYINPFTDKEPAWKVPDIKKAYEVKRPDVLPLYPKLV